MFDPRLFCTDKKNTELTKLEYVSHHKDLFKACNMPLKKTRLHPQFYYTGDSYLASGSNQKGQLGLGHCNFQTVPTPIDIPDETIRVIASKGNHTLFLTDKNNVYSCGSNRFGQLGLGDNIDQVVPKRLSIPNNKKIIAIAMGAFHSLLLTNNNEVYSCGFNENGQLGLGHTLQQNSLQQVHIPNHEKIVAIDAGLMHTLLLTDNNNVYVCGNNTFGELGLGDTDQVITPTSLNFPHGEKIIAISAGPSYSLFLTNKHSVLACGENQFGQLGLGHTSNVNTPQSIAAFDGKKIIAMSAGDFHALYLTDENKIYTCGSNASDQLGMDITYLNKPQSPIFPNQEKIIAIAANQHTSLFWTNKNKSYGCGLNLNFQLGDKIGSGGRQKTIAEFSFSAGLLFKILLRKRNPNYDVRPDQCRIS